MKVLVTGGAGYIGSHTLVELLSNNHEVCVVDNLSNSSTEALNRVRNITGKDFDFLSGDLCNASFLNKVFSRFKPELVVHFAGLKSVKESEDHPLIYYKNNVLGSIQLLLKMDENDCKKIIFSSSATVYGEPIYLPIDELHPTEPLNNYGRTKLVVENILKAWSCNQRKAIILRYFNPVGAHHSGLMGENPSDEPNNLMPYISEVATGKKDILQIFGDNYDTRDGTGERDYIHIIDLAEAHLSALRMIDKISNYEIFNIGTGSGVTVKELIESYREISSKAIPVTVTDRRAGDVASSVASPNKANKELKWKAKYSIEQAIASSLKWKIQNPHGY